MAEKTNAQVALECAVTTYAIGRNTHALESSVTRMADQFLNWLNTNTSKGLTK